MNANNEGITQTDIEQILGIEKYNFFMNLMKNKSKTIEGKHPAKEEMELMSQNYNLFLKHFSKYKGEEEARDFAIQLLEHDYDPSEEIVEHIYLLYKNDSEIKNKIVKLSNLSEKLARLIAKNENLDRKLLSKLYARSDIPADVLDDALKGIYQDYFQQLVASHNNTSPKTLKKIALSGDMYAKEKVANNPNTPPEVLKMLASIDDKYINSAIATNKNATPEILNILYQNK